jgi:hypothetical protein
MHFNFKVDITANSVCLSKRARYKFTIFWNELITSRSRGPRDLGMGLRQLAFWDCGLESRVGGGGDVCLSLLSVVCCQVEVSATGRSVVQRSATERACVIECDQVQHEPFTPIMGRWKNVRLRKKKGINNSLITLIQLMHCFNISLSQHLQRCYNFLSDMFRSLLDDLQGHTVF